MDDFLHNLRSGKLKQQDRGRRDYSDYKGPQRRAGSDRRRPDYYAKVTGENFALVKDALESLAEQQKRIADALTAKTDTESRIADALEVIATRLADVPDTAESQAPKHSPAAQDPTPADQTDYDWKSSGPKLTNDERPHLIQLIAAMRKDGQSWEKIARHMSERGVPTVSGKGTWRGTAVKKFWEANA